MRRILLVGSFIVGSFFLLTISLILLPLISLSSSTISNLHGVTISSDKSYQSYSAVPQVLGAFSEAQIQAADARPLLVDKFLERYDSPFKGSGQYIVQTADKYQIPYGLVPAISQCESNVGKVIPDGSFNAWGYGVYGTTVTSFNSWQDGIDKVSRGLRRDYYNLGLNTPEKIMRKYTPPSDGSWARCVSQYLAELQ